MHRLSVACRNWVDHATIGLRRERLTLEDMRSFESGTMGILREWSAESGSPAAAGGSMTFSKLVCRSDTLGLTSQLLHTSPVREILTA